MKGWRDVAYLLLRLSNDYRAIRKGPNAIGKRLARRAMGKATGRAMGRILR